MIVNTHVRDNKTFETSYNVYIQGVWSDTDLEVIKLSLTHLKRILKLVFCKWPLFILDSLQNYGRLHGYRWIHSVCRKWASSVQDNGRHLLNILDPNGVDRRRRRRLQRRLYRGVGPNFTWHLDCYDKLNPYGICISGCIDGFSRKVIWLQAYHTNSKPVVIAGFLIESVVDEAGSLHRVRADRGTETVVVRDMQTFLRINHQGPRL